MDSGPNRRADFLTFSLLFIVFSNIGNHFKGVALEGCRLEGSGLLTIIFHVCTLMAISIAIEMEPRVV